MKTKINNTGIKVFLDDDKYERFCAMIAKRNGVKKATYIKDLVENDLEVQEELDNKKEKRK